ncbi:hypothetical protein HYALB_00002858 [Hymenoscyphus albidus]|uniref:Uncharacterized protein n=1 Tax=Hymenoscyphus albidus TaxID=595503 RepID=A0A9N9Q3M2_9HELO|nr:hypothetical protein HYALB_00002858 [Hymenoscyphus albidus]
MSAMSVRFAPSRSFKYNDRMFEINFEKFAAPRVTDVEIIHMCCTSDCRYQEASCPVPCFHTECYDFAKRVGNINFHDSSLRATDYTFEPSVLQKQLRIQSIQQDLATELQARPWPRHLAFELWHIVAGFLTREYAIRVSERLEYCLFKRSVSNSLLDLYWVERVLGTEGHGELIAL